MTNILHHFLKLENIIHEMRNHVFKPIEATPAIKVKTKQPFDMLMLFFRPGENVVKIFRLTDIRRVEIEIIPLGKFKLVHHCKICQV